MWLALCLLVAACGRVGFDEQRGNGGAFDGGALDGARAPDSYDGPGTIDLVVESEGSNAGAPIDGADVLVENGSGFDRTTTAADGTASFSVAGPTTFHVAYLVSGLWRVYTINAARAGSTVTLGGQPGGAATSASMTLSLPAGAGGTYTYSLGRCSNPPNSGGATFAFSYPSTCEARTVHLFAYDLSTADGYIDAGPLTLTANSTDTVPGPYQPMTSHAVHVANLPANTQSVYATIELAQGGDLIILDPDSATNATPNGTTLDTTVSAPPTGNLLELQFNGIQSDPISAFGFEFVPTDTAGNVSVDAAGALPVFTAMTTSPATAGIAWSPLVSAGVIYTVDATAANVHWTAYVNAGTDHVAFPALPAGLAAASPASWNDANVTLYDVPGKNAATLVTTIDHDPTLLDLATSSNISYVPF